VQLFSVNAAGCYDLRMSVSPALTALLKRRVPTLAFTGAGISAESGLATFRGPGGMWEGREPTELATLDAFLRDPEMVWRFYEWRRQQARQAQPNAAHLALARWEALCPDFKLVTQNVDGLHERAGNKAALRLHGSIWRLRCLGGCDERDGERLEFASLPPRCECGELLRPGVVWFGEPLGSDTLARAARWAEATSLVLVIGTSSMVYPAAELPRMAQAAGAYVVEINPETTPLSDAADERLPGLAGEIVPELVRLLSADVESEQ